ncbi:MAG: T9SS type A sorting domain-containing protein [Bacteroidota bacterium]
MLLLSHYLTAQTTVFAQGFENAAVMCTENWGFAGGTVNNSTSRTGTKSARVGRLTENSTITFNTVNISSLTGVQLQIYHSVRSTPGPGMDSREGACIQVSLNGGAWTNIGQVAGISDANWGWNATGGSASSSTGCTIYQCTNPLNYAVPANTTSIALRAISVVGGACASFNTNMNTGVAALYDRNDEGFYIDDVKLSTTGDVPGLWTGAISTDWFNCKNWYYNQIPTTTSDVTIDQTAGNICIVDAAGSAMCRNINITSSNATASALVIQGASALTSSGNVTVTKTAGSNISSLEVTGSNCLFSCNNLTLTGSSSAAGNAKFINEFHLNTITVNGNFTLQPGGQLDMNSVSDYGILNLKGNYSNNGLESDFIQTNSFMVMNGTGNQTISTNSFTEVFYNLVVSKTSGSVLLNANVNIENLLNLQGGLLNLNKKQITILNNTSSGIVRNSGGIISEQTDNSSTILWKINATQDIFIFPFMRNDAIYIPLTFQSISGVAGDVTASTYGTSGGNLPWPTSPVAVSNLNNAAGQNDSTATVDRFWHLDVSGSPTVNLTFTYAPDELPQTPFNNSSNIKAQNYTNKWQSYMPSQTAGTYFVTIPSAISFSTFALTNTASPLPVSLLNFNAVKKEDVILVTWITASEENNDFFTVEKSDDGKYFSEVGIVDGAGNSNNVRYYRFEDVNPIRGLSYYRLRQTDFNGNFSLSKIVPVTDGNDAIKIFPNPVKDHLFISLEDDDVSRITIFDIDGRIIYTTDQVRENTITAIDLRSLSKGIYFLQFESQNQSYQKKFIKE